MLTSLFLNQTVLLSSLFYIIGVFMVFQVCFAGIKKIIVKRNLKIDTFTLRSILGIIYILGLLFMMQKAIPAHQSSWVYVNFQMVSVIFYTVILSVPHKYHLFTPIVIAFMLFNSAIFHWESWCMAIVLILFYNTLNYLKDHTKDRFPFWKYLISSIFFGTLYWFFVKIKFSISNPVFFKEALYLTFLEIFTFGYIAVLFADVTSRTALFRDATHDKLTSAYNYDAFDMTFRQMFTHNKKSNVAFSMMMFDVDRFKSINDTYGHLAGDKVLQNVVDIVQTVIDNNDSSVTLYRTGGEEFNVLFPNYSLNETKHVVNEIFSALNHSEIKLDSDVVHLTVSMGVSEIDESDVSVNDFYSRVDKALYQSKRHGRKEITIA